MADNKVERGIAEMFIMTKSQILALGPCSSGVENFESHHGTDKETLTFDDIVESNSISEIIWVVRHVLNPDEIKQISLRFALATGERVLPHFEAKFPDDKRPYSAFNLTRRQLSGEEVPRSEIRQIQQDARSARKAAAYADVAADAAYAAAYAAADAAAADADAAAYAAAADAAADAAAYAAADAAYAAAYAAAAADAAAAYAAAAAAAAAYAAVRAADAAAAYAAAAAAAAAYAAVRAADARKAERETQKQLLKTIINEVLSTSRTDDEFEQEVNR